MGRNTDDQVSEPLARGASIGRYVVLGLLGRGGMGEVYAAFDPELDRKVAVKLLRARIENGVSNSEGRQRTLREAQAIARLSHPNVVTVFDVGTFGEQVFIAMEFVDGHTASYWAQAQPRTWQETLKVYLTAGRGLQAAHEKGLVHRDFKPENVMVGRDGEVRVMDFGLAREIEGRATRNGPVTTSTVKFGDVRTDGGTIVLHQQKPDAPPVALANDDGVVREMQDTQPSPGSLDLFGARLTRTGAIMGTPAYMAPEQFFKAATDARSDQFSFCVTLYEALYGERPFPGNNIQTLVGNIVQGNIRPPPAGTKVPAWVRKILLRGLRPTAAERYPSMAELLDALKTDPRQKYRKFAVGVALGVVPLLLGFGVRQLVTEKTVSCTDGSEKLAHFWELTPAGAPEGPSQRKIHEAFLSTGKSYAADVYETVRRSLSQYARRWSETYKETCEATQVRHEQSPEVLDLRMSCLNERLNGMRALTQVFATANDGTVENAASAVDALGTLDRCSNVALLRAVIQPPEDRKTRALVDDLRVQLADLKAQFDAGQWKQALRIAPPLIAAVRSSGYKPLEAEALALLGQIQTNASPAAAEQDLSEAYEIADASRHDEVRAEVSTALVFVVGLQGRFDDAKKWFGIATAVLQRVGGHDLMRAWLLNNFGCAQVVHHDTDAAVSSLTDATALKQTLLGPDNPDVGVSESNLANILLDAGRYDAALAHVDRALNILKKKLGPNHPVFARSLNNRGEVLNGLRRYDEARDYFLLAEKIWERELGPDSTNLGYSLTGIGLSFLGQGRPANAVEPLQRALKIRESNRVDATERAETSFALAQALWESGHEPAWARRLARDARLVYVQRSLQSQASQVDKWLEAHVGS